MKKIIALLCMLWINLSSAQCVFGEALPLLSKAAMNGNVKEIQRLLESGANIHARTNDGWTVLMFAALSGHTQAIQTLLDNRADIHARVTMA